MARILPFVLFFAVACSLVAGLHYYLWLRVVRDPGLVGPWARALTATIAGLGVAMPLTLIGSRFFQGANSRPLLFLSFSWMGIGFLLAGLFFAVDVGRLLVGTSLWLAARAGSSGAPVDPARRLLITRVLTAAVGVAGVGLSAIGLREALGAMQVKELVVKIKGLPAALSGFKLVQISDVHIGPLLHKEWLSAVVDRIVALVPDLVVITGDLVDGSVAQLRSHVEPLRRLSSAPRGVFFVTGNHEYYSGADEWLAHLPTLGVRPLRNEHLEVAPGLDLAGIDDLMAHIPGHGADLPRALAGRDAGKPVVLLAHQPKQFLEAAERGVDLTLSGHTHGGQLWPFTWLVGLVQPFVAGLHRRGDSQLYVSRGTGFWGPPLRLAAPAEITLIRLVPA